MLCPTLHSEILLIIFVFFFCNVSSHWCFEYRRLVFQFLVVAYSCVGRWTLTQRQQQPPPPPTTNRCILHQWKPTRTMNSDVCRHTQMVGHASVWFCICEIRQVFVVMFVLVHLVFIWQVLNVIGHVGMRACCTKNTFCVMAPGMFLFRG